MLQDRSLRFRVDSMSRCSLFVVAIVVLVFIGTSLLVGSLIRLQPTSIEITNQLEGKEWQEFLMAPVTNGTKSHISLVSPPVGPANQALTMSLRVMRMSSSVECIPGSMYCPSFNFHLVPLLLSMSLETDQGIRGWQRSHTVATNASGASILYERDLSCRHAEACDLVPLIHIASLSHTRYRLNVTLHGRAGGASNDATDIFTLLGGITRGAKSVVSFTNDEFSYYEVTLRAVLNVISGVVAVLFVVAMRRQRITSWATEQKWTLGLLILLLMFDNPLLILYVRTGHLFFALQNVISMTTFLAALLIAWLVIADLLVSANIRPRLRFVPFYVPKLALVGSLWLMSIAGFLFQYMRAHPDGSPADTNLDNTTVVGVPVFRYLKVALLFVYAFWLTFLGVRIFSQYGLRAAAAASGDSTPSHPAGTGSHGYSGASTAVWVTTVLMLLITAAAFVQMHGLSTPGDLSTVEVTVFFTTLNVYIWLVALFLSPARGLAGRHHMRLGAHDAGAVSSPVPSELQGDDELFYDHEDARTS